MLWPMVRTRGQRAAPILPSAPHPRSPAGNATSRPRSLPWSLRDVRVASGMEFAPGVSFLLGSCSRRTYELEGLELDVQVRRSWRRLPATRFRSFAAACCPGGCAILRYLWCFLAHGG